MPRGGGGVFSVAFSSIEAIFVTLPKGFDPGERCGVRNKRDGERLLQQGAELLAEYQDRLAAQQTYRPQVGHPDLCRSGYRGNAHRDRPAIPVHG